MSHFYSLPPQAVNDLSIRTFWCLSDNIDRIQAQKDMRQLTVAVCGQSDEQSKKFRERLELEVGTIVKTAPAALYAERDVAGFEELRAMAKQR